ncbi:uncharacterized protein LOC112052766 [Bicyclus anynana]|uniref:Uncharacterized protein LOC112052766 n=1 Tax=Bicyclus anynana TaxID=110368 RepID=A0ABM3LNN0_BICAN|nr:uncharacterized protein LOC112052766 [Bicyclus anynana]
MLKNFWECVNGSPVDNEVCRTKLNRGSQNTAWPKSDTHNEIMLRLPRALRHGNLIEINGTFQANTQRIRLNLTKGLDKPDIKSIACWTEINFAEGYVSGSKNVQLDKDPPKGEDLKKDLFPGNATVI